MISIATTILFVLFFAIGADAQRGGKRGGGGGGFSRGGTASGGSFSGARTGAANQGQRRQSLDSNQQNRQSYGQSAQANRQGAYDNHWDNYHPYGGAVAPGTAVATSYTVGAMYYSTPPCNPIVVNVGGTTYYQCYPDWYTQVYSDSGVIYAVVQAPEGY